MIGGERFTAQGIAGVTACRFAVQAAVLHAGVWPSRGVLLAALSAFLNALGAPRPQVAARDRELPLRPTAARAAGAADNAIGINHRSLGPADCVFGFLPSPISYLLTLLHPLNHHADSLSHADAHRAERIAATRARELSGGCRDESGAARPERMTDGDCPAVWVDVCGIVSHAEIAQHGERLGRERFVELDDVHLRDRQSALVRAPCGWRAQGRSP